MILGENKAVAEVKDIDIQNYAKFLLKEGSDQEKRDLIGCLKGEIQLKMKNICLVNQL